MTIFATLSCKIFLPSFIPRNTRNIFETLAFCLLLQTYPLESFAQELVPVKDNEKGNVGSKDSQTFEEFKRFWDAAPGPPYEKNIQILGNEQQFVLDLGSRIVGEVVPIKLVLENKLASRLSAVTKASCGCTLGMPEVLYLGPEQSLETLLTLEVPKNASKFESSITCYDVKQDVRFFIRLQGQAIDDFRVTPSVIDLQEDSSTFVEIETMPLDPSKKLGNASIVSTDEGVIVEDIADLPNGGKKLRISVAAALPNLVSRQFSVRHDNSRSQVFVSLIYINRVRAFPRVAVFRKDTNHPDVFSSKVSLKGNKVEDLLEFKDSYSVLYVDGTSSVDCDLELNKSFEGADCVLHLRPTPHLSSMKKSEIRFVKNGSFEFSIPAILLEK